MAKTKKENTQPPETSSEFKPVILGDIDKGKGEIIRVEVSEFKGKKLLNIRVWYTDTNGEKKPTQKGITISSELYADVKKAVVAAGSLI